ncbi:MAG: hypothetical protein OXQ89_07485 [Rhodospirillaceae bacterium]|nr:hypothetical protein [Rhodospirillaceae bacterium]
MNNGRLDRALLLTILAAMGGLYWQMFSMNARLSAEIAEVNTRLSAEIAEVNTRLSAEIAEVDARLYAAIAALSERLARVETHLEYIVPRSTDTAPEQSPID